MTAALTEQLNDNEYELVVEALYALRANKTAALQEAGQHAATRSFTAHDFGVPKIDALLTRLDAKVPMDEADAVIANCNIQIPLKGYPLTDSVSSPDANGSDLQGRSTGNAVDTALVDPAGNKQVSYGPRRIKVERIVNGKSYVSYRDHHPVAADPGVHVEACLPENAAFWGVYRHETEGMAAIVGNAHDRDSAKVFAEVAARNLELEARLATAVDAASPVPSVEVGIRLEGGVIQSIWSNQPVNVLVIDYDTEDRQEDQLFDLPQDDGSTSECAIVEFPAVVMPGECQRIRDVRIERDANAEDEPQGMAP